MHKCNIVSSASDGVSRECVLKESVIMLCVLNEMDSILSIVSGRVSIPWVVSGRVSVPCIVSGRVSVHWILLLVLLPRPSGFAICIPSVPCARALGTQNKFLLMVALYRYCLLYLSS